MATLYIGHTTKRPLTHVQYIRKLHLEPIHLKDADMYEDNTFGADHHHHHLLSRPQDATAPDERATAEYDIHSSNQVDEWRNQSGRLKRVQRYCIE
ncbi:hypothetical protein F442_16641 [Phytophthora nicotianae P10297]|uniref:Uncharacterized protein n=2 Tax=Phytophthora nicotianae TaxID=4792 RepID=V9EF21_PHYNI|nr:hypothetical protein F443_16810 [Phytophthora nicotianae P1569]ETP35117.1 hypothetical protein F442_16641 [Phytophthora nicotianae P10297]